MRRTVPHPEVVLENLLRQNFDIGKHRELQLAHAALTQYTASGGQDFRNETLATVAKRAGLRPTVLTSKRTPFTVLVRAHRAYSNAIEVPHDTHPNGTLDSLLAQGFRPERQFNLRRLGDFCERQHRKGFREFTRAALGQAWQDEYGEKAFFATYYDKGLTLLIDAWQEYANPVLKAREKRRRRQVSQDLDLSWAYAKYPQLDEWSLLASTWLKEQMNGLTQHVAALRKFYAEYLSQMNPPESPAQLLARRRNPPEFKPSGLSASTHKLYLASISKLVDWILRNHLSFENDDGYMVPSPAFWNPFEETKQKLPGGRDHSETVLSPLPYAYIEELRSMVCEGPDFKDWHYARRALGAQAGDIGRPGGDWVQIDSSRIDESDPDCVFRTRVEAGRTIYEIWEPVRWVALLLKLMTPLRTGQVRLLDSGEADTWTYNGEGDGGWVLNDHPLASGTERSPVQQGVFRRPMQTDEDQQCSLYINTNKTADDKKVGEAKGLVQPWPHDDDISANPYYWLRKLRNWQRKYNPVTRLVHWSELDARHITSKSEAQLARFAPAAFLFRTAMDSDSSYFPVSNSRVESAWDALVYEFEQRMVARHETHPGGAPIRLTRTGADGYPRSNFPLHSLRVSLITALMLDGDVSSLLMAKAVGHSRSTMTEYYGKLTPGRLRSALKGGVAKLVEKRRANLDEFLLTAEVDQLMREAISTNASALLIAIPQNPAQRNRTNWMHMHHGICLMGGNTSAIISDPKVGGCHNGGAPIRFGKAPLYGPVPGGARNCVRCRWFVTAGRYLSEMVDQFNIYAYHCDEARIEAVNRERAWVELRTQKAELESQGLPFLQAAELADRERVRQTSMAKFIECAQDMRACLRLVERCKRALQSETSDGRQLITNAEPDEVKVVIDRTSSELQQLNGVCEALEFCSDFKEDAAIYRRQQMLDAALAREGQPAYFLTLSRDEQLLVGNELMRRLSMRADAQDRHVGMRKAVRIIDAGEYFIDNLGVHISSILGEMKREREMPALDRDHGGVAS